MRRLPLLLAGLAAVLAASVFAQAPDVKVELTGQRVQVTDGKETFASADKAGPGDVIQYTAVYRNTGDAAAKNLVATVPIPQGLALIAESAKPAAPQASIDGKNFSATPLVREVKNEAGVLEKQPVPLADYRALRWTIAELAPGQSATFLLRAQVENNNQ